MCSATSFTAMPASFSARAVPPVDRISTPRAASARAKSTRPVLSETEIRARSILGAAAAAGSVMGMPSVGDVEQDRF